jgi:uncharacterized protein YdeI (YjbR/CyaY-like superfamily)
MTDPLYFATEGEMFEWFRDHSAGLSEIWLGVYKKVTKIPSITITQAMDAAVIFGWSESKWVTIDKIRFKIRLTPRIPGKTFTLGTARRYLTLEAQGLIQPSGQAAWEARDVEGTALLLRGWQKPAFRRPPGM